MGTRSGDIDPAIVSFLADKEGKTADEIIDICNKKSGVLGLSGGLSSDFRDLAQAAEGGDEKAAAALETWSYRVAKYIGAYTAAMNGVDVIAFTAGVGENNVAVRAQICEYLGYLGVTIDAEANKQRGEEVRISTADSRTQVWVVPTNEELAIARETARLVY
jgi:acetate kinase